MTTRTLGIAVFVLAIVFLQWAEGPPQSLIHIPSVIYFVFATGGLALARYRRRGGTTSLLSMVKRYAILCGLVGFLLGLLQAMYHLHTAEAIIAGVRVALMPMLYGLVVYCIADVLSAGDESSGRGEEC